MDIKIVAKIQKLLALSESSNEHEAHLAMLKAQELLAKHKLSLKEVKELSVYNSAIKDKVTTISFKKAKWKALLAKLIANNFGCYTYFKVRNTNMIAFFGREEDIAICNIVLEYAVDSINSKVKRLRYEYSRNGYSTKGLENDYALGFIKGLSKKYEEQNKTNQEWGLVLAKDEEVVEAFGRKRFSRSYNANIEFQGYSDVYHEGRKDGSKFNISDKITEGEEPAVLSLGYSV